MSRLDRSRGPERATPEDIERINKVFSEAFTDRYQRDGLSGVRVPPLNPAIWRYAIAGAADGALVWRDRSKQLVAFIMVHRSGAEGWMGPLAVRPDRHRFLVCVDAMLDLGPCRDQASMIATARVQPAEPPRTFTGKQLTMKPSAGSASRLWSFSI